MQSRRKSVKRGGTSSVSRRANGSGSKASTSSVEFLSFPREIRHRIYECILTEPNLILSTCQTNAATPLFHASSRKNRNVEDLNIFRVSKQVFAEARVIFFSQNTFDINLIEEGTNVRHNFVPTSCDYAIEALRHLKIFVHVLFYRPDSERTREPSGALAKLKHILDRATDLRTLELWLETGDMKLSGPNTDDDEVFATLKGIKQLRRLKLIISTAKHDGYSSLAKYIQNLRAKMLANAARSHGNPVWAAVELPHKWAPLTMMCHDDHLGNTLLSNADRRCFQSNGVVEYKGENMSKTAGLII